MVQIELGNHISGFVSRTKETASEALMLAKRGIDEIIPHAKKAEETILSTISSLEEKTGLKRQTLIDLHRKTAPFYPIIKGTLLAIEGPEAIFTYIIARELAGLVRDKPDKSKLTEENVVRFIAENGLVQLGRKLAENIISDIIT